MTDLTIWQRLSAPIPADCVSWRQDGKVVTRKDGTFAARFVPYIEANTVRQRLDEVVPGWDSELTALENANDSDGTAVQAFKCRLHIYWTQSEAEGSGIAHREDVGQGSDYKSAATDAFKRAAVRFGIGQELYDYEQLWVAVDSDSKYAKPLEDPGDAYARLVARRGKPQPNGSGEQRVDPTPTTTRPRSSVRSASTTSPHASASIAAPSESPPCPICGGEMWNNKAKKESGTFKPSAPDLKCKDRECEGRYDTWPPAPAKAGARSSRGPADDDAPWPE